MKIKMKTIPPNEHRYPTLGDYWTDNTGTEQIRSTEFLDWRYTFLIFLHEFVETYLCKHRCIGEHEITAFDEDFEASGKIGEPGDSRDAPYYEEHQFAQAIEMLMAQKLDVNWNEYVAEQEKTFKNTWGKK